MYATTPQKQQTALPWLLLVLLAGGLVAVLLGVYGRVHEPVGASSTTMVFFDISFAGQGMLRFKSLFTTIAIVFALIQLVSGLRLRDRISFPKNPPLWYADFHRLCGTLALLFSVPVAYHCLWSLGFKSSSPRALIHSFLGCFFYGAFVTKVLAVRSDKVPSWMVPIMGGIVLTALAGIWLSSALFFYMGKIG